MIDFFFSNLNKFSVGFFLLFFVFTWGTKRLSGKKVSLESIVANSLSSATIPTSIALILCAFDESLVTKINGVNLHISIAGMVLLFVSLRIIEKDW